MSGDELIARRSGNIEGGTSRRFGSSYGFTQNTLLARQPNELQPNHITKHESKECNRIVTSPRNDLASDRALIYWVCGAFFVFALLGLFLISKKDERKRDLGFLFILLSVHCFMFFIFAAREVMHAAVDVGAYAKRWV